MNHAKRIEPDVSAMSVEEKIGQMLMVRYPDREILRSMLADGTAGSFYFGMQGLSAREVAATLNELQSIARVPALIAFGSSTTSCGTGLLRGSQMRIGATRSADIAYEVGFREAREQRAYGCHIIDAPCLDVNTNPANPIINTRAFGDDPELVAELGLAMLRGIIDGRGVTCGMHFPGHGATSDDSHIRVPVDARDADTLWAIDLLPWRRAVAESLLNGVCTNHVHYPALNPGDVAPSTVSRAVITGLLREKLGYDGLIMSDSLTMKPMKDAFGIEESAVLTVLAGHDIILQDYQSEPSITLNAVVRAAKGGRIPMAQIDASVRRILALKRWLGLFDNPLVDAEGAESRVNTAENRALARRVAESAITALETEAIPLRVSQDEACLVLTWGGASGSSHDAQSDAHVTTGASGFVQGLAKRVSNLNHVALSRESTDIEFAEARRAAAGAHTVIVGLFPRVVCYQEDSVRLAPSMVELVRHAASCARRFVVLVFGNPYVLQDLPQADATLCAYDHACAESIESSLEVLFGALASSGRLPVTVPESYPFGSGC